MNNNELKNIAQLKLQSRKAEAKLISIIKKYRKEGISVIKKDIENGDAIFSCSFSGEEIRFSNLLKLHDELIAAGYIVELYDEGVRSSIEYFRNWSNTINEISRQIDADDSWIEEDK